MKTLILLVVFMLAMPVPAANAQQGECGTVDAVDWPLDPREYRLYWDYEGFWESIYGYHNGEDWMRVGGESYGQPVRAIARGKVVASGELLWGANDRGVVVLLHIFPGGKLIYSLYGHLDPIGDYVLPPVGACVEMGDIVGAIGRTVDPGPHLHWEVRTFPEPHTGYSEYKPSSQGWLDPSRFVANWKAWLSNAHHWHAELEAPVPANAVEPAALLPGDVTVYLSGQSVGAVDANGERVWRYKLGSLPDEVWGVYPIAEGRAAIVGKDGSVQEYNAAGFHSAWTIGEPILMPPEPFQGGLLFLTSDGALGLYNSGGGATWKAPDIGMPIAFAVNDSDGRIGVITGNGVFYHLNEGGTRLGMQSYKGDLGTRPDGGLYLWTPGDVFHVPQAGGEPVKVAAFVPVNEESTGTVIGIPGGRVAAAIARSALFVYDGEGKLLWNQALPVIHDEMHFAAGPCHLYAVMGNGQFIAYDAKTGNIAAHAKLFNPDERPVWIGVGADGLARFVVNDTITAFDPGTCAP